MVFESFADETELAGKLLSVTKDVLIYTLLSPPPNLMVGYEHGPLTAETVVGIFAEFAVGGERAPAPLDRCISEVVICAEAESRTK